MAVDEVVDYPRCGHTVDSYWFQELIFFRGFDHIAGVRVRARSLVNDLCRKSIARAKLIFNPVTVRISQPNSFIALCEACFTTTDVLNRRPLAFPPTSEQVLNAGLHRTFKIINLRL